MSITFDIIEYISSLTAFQFDIAVLKRIALERNAADITSVEQVSKKQRDLILADLLYTAYLSPYIWSSFSSSHGNFSKSVGGQTISNRDELLIMAKRLYAKYNDEMLEEIGETGNLQFLDL